VKMMTQSKKRTVRTLLMVSISLIGRLSLSIREFQGWLT
jgi:hypothetical protein